MQSALESDIQEITMINSDFIKNLRDGLKLSPYQMAKELGMDLKTYEKIERGEAVNLNSLAKISDKFNLPLSKLVRD